LDVGEVEARLFHSISMEVSCIRFDVSVWIRPDRRVQESVFRLTAQEPVAKRDSIYQLRSWETIRRDERTDG
jgi:hypothetical protein